MQTAFSSELLASTKGQQADKILRACVHCGFCTATCPTFLLTGNELDSPRGRIYLIKEMLEGNQVSHITRTHLDRCLSCQSCETTCPSSVDYHRLLSIGRELVASTVPYSLPEQYRRKFLRHFLSRRGLFTFVLNIARAVKFILPRKLRKSITLPQKSGRWPKLESKRRMLILNGCVQSGLSPNTNFATARVLAKLGVQLTTLDKEGCCGALDYHMSAHDDGLNKARHNVDLICQFLDAGGEAVISTASGCGNFVKEYAEILSDDAAYAEKASRVVAHCKDLSEILVREDLSQLKINSPQTLAFHCPCSLQHGQQLGTVVESILGQLGFTLESVQDSHLCCGSAGTYSIFQPELSQQLQTNKIRALEHTSPEGIATANIGCQSHLSAVSSKPIKHWIEYVDNAMGHGV